ncbi:MAG: anti-sigma factor antagonist [Synechococcaceae cyanobacterium SM2_3_2]|nr:anti-sigma factor antagonist [Synechococcaceae cyanobacterium SM2_3_2]
MDITIQTNNDITIAQVVGEIDGKTAPSAQENLVPLTQGGGKLILDLSQVSYMSSAGLRVLLLLYRQMAGNNGQIALVGLSEELKDTMSITGFLKFFLTSETLADGIAALST